YRSPCKTPFSNQSEPLLRRETCADVVELVEVLVTDRERTLTVSVVDGHGQADGGGEIALQRYCVRILARFQALLTLGGSVDRRGILGFLGQLLGLTNAEAFLHNLIGQLGG